MAYEVQLASPSIKIAAAVAVAGTLPTLSTDGVDIRGLRGATTRKRGPLYTGLRLARNGVTNISLTAAKLYGWSAIWEEESPGLAWSFLADIKAGAVVAVTAQGVWEVFMNLPLVDRVMIVAGSVSGGGAYDGWLYPLDLSVD